MDDRFGLQRFVDAQAPLIGQVERELAGGTKRTHWMWFVFPQLRGLGRSPMSQHYGIGSAAEARAYLAHPLLGARLVGCTELVLGVRGQSAHEIFGSPDDMKFHSCMTLFAAMAGKDAPFTMALQRYFDGEEDRETVRLLGG